MFGKKKQPVQAQPIPRVIEEARPIPQEEEESIPELPQMENRAILRQDYELTEEEAHEILKNLDFRISRIEHFLRLDF